MEAVILMGLQASGKSTFYKERFFNTHVRINLDMLRTRHREKTILETCLGIKQPFVVDNTNPAIADRVRYIVPAKEAGFSVVGYYMQSHIKDCLERNSTREGKARVPAVAIYGAEKRLQLPSYAEGFDKLYYVRISGEGGFVVEDWVGTALTDPVDPLLGDGPF